MTIFHSRLAAPMFALALAACGGDDSTNTSTSTSTESSTVTVPGAPTALAATAGNASAVIAFTVPTSNGGAAITAYTATCMASGGMKTGTAGTSPVTVSGLSNATAYTCWVAASNSQGTGSVSEGVVVTPVEGTGTGTGTTRRFKAEVWADNWFSLSVGETWKGEDSIAITTERSFNSEIVEFDASYPLDLNFVVKDYKQDDSGLEYIGAANQKMGDGGFIMQVTDTTTGKIVAVSNAALKCLVVHKAPLNPTCEKSAVPSVACLSRIDAEPSGWKGASYDVSGWESATVYTATQIGAKEGYDAIAWDSSAKLVWTSDLETDNTLLCKVRVTGE